MDVEMPGYEYFYTPVPGIDALFNIPKRIRYEMRMAGHHIGKMKMERVEM